MKLLFVLVAAVLLAGCGKFYWSKPGGTFADFSQDHRDCAREVAMSTSASKEYGVVPPKFYQACMKGRGWTRAQQFEPVPAGWYRGIEDDEIVRLDAPPPQPQTAPSPSPPARYR